MRRNAEKHGKEESPIWPFVMRNECCAPFAGGVLGGVVPRRQHAPALFLGKEHGGQRASVSSVSPAKLDRFLWCLTSLSMRVPACECYGGVAPKSLVFFGDRCHACLARLPSFGVDNMSGVNFTLSLRAGVAEGSVVTWG